MIPGKNIAVPLSDSTKLAQPTSEVPTTSRVVLLLLWLLFLGNAVWLITMFSNLKETLLGDFLRFNRFTLLMWTTVTFFSAVICTYAIKYLTGFKYNAGFMLRCLAFTISVMLLVVSNHISLLLLSWLAMGVFMSQLIGIDKRWGEATEASRFTRKYFFTGTGFLALGLVLLSVYTNQFTLSGIIAQVDTIPTYILLPAALCIITAAIVQSAMYPFQRWLLSAMTAPTPASALMHAGFVNGGGILLTLFSVFLFASNTLTILFVIGGLTAITAQFTKLLQVNVKQKLACSTIAQMGFMIMQCGLGFFNAAIVHLILHGFYKAYLFLSSGEEVAQLHIQSANKLKIKPLQAIVVLLYGCLGAYLFLVWTGKTSFNNSGIFLTLIVAITVGQVTYNIVKQHHLSLLQKIVAPCILFIAGIGIYALLYNGVTALMADLPMVAVPTEITWVQVVFSVLFLLGFFIMKLGVYKKIPWLYVKLLNISQPYKKTVLMYKSNSL